MITHQPMTVKRFCYEQSISEGITPNAIFYRLKRGYYPEVKRMRLNKRVVFIAKNQGKICPLCGHENKAEIPEG